MARARAQERNRDALVDAALDEFYEGRWQKVSLEALAARAGVTKQTLLRHFGSKDGLLLQALLRGAEQVLDQRWSAPTDDIAGAVANLVDHYEAWGERSLRIGAWQTGRRSSPSSRRRHASCTTTGSSTRSARGWTVATARLARAAGPR